MEVNNNISEPVKQEIVRNRQGQFVKNAPSPNPLGARLGIERLSALFSKAFFTDKDKHKGRDLFEYAFERAHTNDKVLVALLNKFVPDLVKGEGFGTNITTIFGNLDAGRRDELIEILRKRQGARESV